MVAMPSRDKILDVAEALFARRGFSGVGLREVAQQVGLGKSSLFHHFPTKRALYDEVLARVLARLDEHLAPVTAAHDLPPAERLDRWIDTVIDVLAAHPTTARLTLRSLFEEDDANGRSAHAEAPWALTLTRLTGCLERLLAEGLEAGAFRGVSAGHLTQTILGATVYHFASSEFGAGVVGAPLFSAVEVARRKDEVKRVVRAGVIAMPAASGGRQ